MKTPHERALDVFTGGIANGEFGLPADMIEVVRSGKGCELQASSGKTYLDFSMGWGSCLVGHAHPAVVEAVARQAPLGSNFSYLNEPVLALAEEIKARCPAVERLRFCASGTEATMYCQRLARAVSGKPKILKFEGAYHGANETGVTSLFASGETDFPEPELTSAGVPEVRDNLLVAPYNDLARTREILDQHQDDIAGIIVEPLQRCYPPRPGFLEGLRQAATELGIFLIFDEVVTGFRLARGGAQEYYGVLPDLVAYGKALGGGYPIGAFGGHGDLMEWVNEQRIGGDDYVWMASTLGGNPISAAAARAALTALGADGVYPRLHGLGAVFRAQLAEVVAKHQIPAQIIGDGPLAQIVFSATEVFDHRSANAGDKALGRAMMLGLFQRGIFLNPMGTKLYLSLAHDSAICDQFCDRLDDTLSEIK